MKTFLLSETALRNLEEIRQKIAENNPSRAASFIAELIERARIAQLLPAAGPQLPECSETERYLTHHDYIITYEIEAEQIVVTRFFHAALDLTRH